MGDYQTFKTYLDAEAEIAKMRGWETTPKRMYLPGDPNADRKGMTWVIECNGRLYLRTDGYVR